ncbi:major facilitator superfamily domain-containing protein 6 isoform X2 [Prorops nasuta]|uniref:major facilitator superfamily domain-containing protein 6 isoform X2 n=1 Tax=Prorops nasuta TaxID=863751 RepID=UPI0034CDFC2E
MQNYGHEDYDYGPPPDDGMQQTSGGRNLPRAPSARPMVDPSAEGEVDPNLYPQPKEATHKIRGKSDFLEYLFGAVDQELLTVKTFYFFFYSAFGSLFPLMGVYFKQMGMNAGQCGLLIGLRPFIEFFSAPFWGSLADRWQKGKLILLASLSCWIIFTLPLGFIQPPATSCMVRRNNTNYLESSNPEQRIVKRSIDMDEFYESSVMKDNDDDLEVAANVVFERLRRSTDGANNEIFNRVKKEPSNARRKASFFGTAYDLSLSDQEGFHNPKNNRDKREAAADGQSASGDGSSEGHVIDFEELHRQNRPSDVEEYKRFLLNKPLNDGKPPKKAYEAVTKERSKPPAKKIMVKRDINDEEAQFFVDVPRWTDFINIGKASFADGNNEGVEDAEDDEDDGVNDVNEPFERNRRSETSLSRRRRSLRIPLASAGQSPLSVSYAANYNEKENKGWVKPLFSSIVYRLPDIQKTFFLLLLLVIVGEFFAAPAITLADSAVITLLGEDADRYGHQRMFGSLGWGLAMFFVGIALDHSTAFPDHPCGPDPREKNYTICFAIFSVLMGAALITATQINFKYDVVVAEPEVVKPPAEPTREEQLQSQLSQQLNLPGLQDSSGSTIEPPKAQPPEGKTKMFAQTTREIPEWVTVIKQFKDLKCASFLFVAWFMGFGIGLIFTFLFWHLQDYGGSPTLFGVASVINHISEIFAYFFSFKLIRQIGHVKVLCLGLAGNVLRFLYISWLKNPWWVLPFEFIQGITHAAVWAACCSYIAHNTPPQLRSSAQGVLQGLHHGLGRGCGAVIGGMFVAGYGTTATFRGYGLICAVVLMAFIFINFYRKDTGFVSDLPQTEDPHQVAEATHLAPHGVPSNAIPRALSSNRLHELANQEHSYGATYQAGANLSVPGANGGGANPNNPFLNGGGGGGGFGGGGSGGGYNYDLQ